jgi:hypothetical protein
MAKVCKNFANRSTRSRGGIPIDEVGSAKDLKFAADQGIADAQYNYGFFCIMAKAFRLIRVEQHIILNWPQIKKLLILNTIMEFICGMAKAF